MLNIGNVDWYRILCRQAEILEKDMSIKIDISKPICLEIGRLVNDNLTATGLIHPNVAKIAGQVAFWIRKLKPLSLSNNTPNLLLTINEYTALLIGLAICQDFKDDTSKPERFYLPPRVFRDWVNSLRYHSHSPASSMLAFEILSNAS